MHSLGQGVWWTRRQRDRAGDLESRRGQIQRAGWLLCDWTGHGSTDIDDLGSAWSTTRGICRNSPAAKKFGVSCSPNLQVDRISQLCVPRQNVMETTGLSTDKKSGPLVRKLPGLWNGLCARDPTVLGDKGLSYFFFRHEVARCRDQAN